MTSMSYHDNLLKLAAIIYRSGEDDVDCLLATFAADLIREGHRIGGVVQHNVPGASGAHETMRLIDLMTGRAIPIFQPLGSHSQSCRIDPGGIAEATVCVSRAIAADAELLIVNKFAKQESSGGGLRAEIADAVVAGMPILTAVPDTCYEAWMEFIGGFGTTLLCERRVIEAWWRDISWRDSRSRLLERLQGRIQSSAIAAGSEPSSTMAQHARALADHDIGRLDHG